MARSTHFAPRLRTGVVRRLHRIHRDHPTSRGSLAGRLSVPRLLDLGHRTWTVRVCVSLRLDTTSDPFYPLFSGGVAALASIGHAVPFPPQSALGPHCDRAVSCHQTLGRQAGAWHADLRNRLSEHPSAAGRRGRGSAHHRSRPASLGTSHRGDRRAPPARLDVRREHLPPRRPLCHGFFPPGHRQCPQNRLGLGRVLDRLGPGRTALRGLGRHSPLGPGTGAQPPSIRWIRPHRAWR